MNVRKMRQIGKDILAEPRRFNMTFWMIDATALDKSQHARKPPCGTVCCFAGEWGLRYGKIKPDKRQDFVQSGEFKNRHISSACQMDLDMPNQRLLRDTSWPSQLHTKHKPGTVRYAKHFVNVVLENYIATNGWQNEV